MHKIIGAMAPVKGHGSVLGPSATPTHLRAPTAAASGGNNHVNHAPKSCVDEQRVATGTEEVGAEHEDLPYIVEEPDSPSEQPAQANTHSPDRVDLTELETPEEHMAATRGVVVQRVQKKQGRLQVQEIHQRVDSSGTVHVTCTSR